jgi:hypothetical protein
MTKICLFQKFDEDHNVDIDELDIAVNAVATAVKVRRSHNRFTRVNYSRSKVTDNKIYNVKWNTKTSLCDFKICIGNDIL